MPAGNGKEKQALEIIELAFHSSKSCAVFFSGGKDSAAVLDLVKKVYPQERIHPVFMPFVDGLAETDLVIKIAASLGFSLNLYRHWRYFADKAQGSYCLPQGKPKRFYDVYAEVREDFGKDTAIFYGAKRSDGLWRRLVTSKKNSAARLVYAPVYEWSKYDVLSYIRKNRLDYLKQEGDRISGVDLSDKYLAWSYQNQRQSYEALKKEFPFIDAAIKRHEFFKESWKEAQAVAKTETYQMIEINRADIKNAPYNPRRISKEAKEKLKRGLAAPLAWNRRTGSLVAGHQRITRIDRIEGVKDYTLQAAAIDADEKQEKEISVLLNSQSAQGEFDLDK